MPWKEQDLMSLREDFVRLAAQEDVNMSALCREYDICRKTGYKWLQRSRMEDSTALCDRSRRPHRIHGQTPAVMEDRILAVRASHPTWGPRKIRAFLTSQEVDDLPAPSTISAILRRRGQINSDASAQHHAFQSFAMENPNELWQMDFKGYFSLSQGKYCHPLTVLDDHSRFLIGLRACSNETFETVKAVLSDCFRQYGLPQRILVDNGSPWGDDEHSHHTILTAWLMRLGIEISHGRAYHPQTQGKVERLHRTLNEDLLLCSTFDTLDACQKGFDQWRETYNNVRPHEALSLTPPAMSYRSSEFSFSEQLPPIIYEQDDILRSVDLSGKISFRGRAFRIGRAFIYQPVALRPTNNGFIYNVFYCKECIKTIDLRKPVR
jgi:transposase InsO family protein